MGTKSGTCACNYLPSCTNTNPLAAHIRSKKLAPYSLVEKTARCGALKLTTRIPSQILYSDGKVAALFLSKNQGCFLANVFFSSTSCIWQLHDSVRNGQTLVLTAKNVAAYRREIPSSCSYMLSVSSPNGKGPVLIRGRGLSYRLFAQQR